MREKFMERIVDIPVDGFVPPFRDTTPASAVKDSQRSGCENGSVVTHLENGSQSRLVHPGELIKSVRETVLVYRRQERKPPSWSNS